MNIPKYLEGLFRIASESDVGVLITGPTGTGKTTLAQKIHAASSRRNFPFVNINLACLHEGTLESELFGHERGSFTGAEKRRIGRLEMAEGGTVFLDEIGDLTPRLQARLLEFLQTHTLLPVGSNTEIRLNVRVIAATHRDLSKMVEKKEFREDLFHRIRVLNLHLKSLTERREDFDAIVHACLSELCRKNGKTILRLSPGIAEQLEGYHWPGNIRELRNLLEFALLTAKNDEIGVENLPDWFLRREKSEGDALAGVPVLGVAELPLSLDFHQTRARFEKEYLHRALSRYGGRINRTAQQIGLNKATLLRRLRAYQISV